MDYKLDIKTTKTVDGLFNIDYDYVKAPLDVQVDAFALNKLGLVSPSQYFKMIHGQPKGHHLLVYTRSNMDVYNDKQTGNVVLIKGGLLGNKYTKDIVAAHSKNKEFVLQEDAFADYIMNIALHGGDDSIRMFDSGNKVLSTENLDQDIADFIITDADLRITAKDHGKYLNEVHGIKNITMYLDDTDYIKNQNGSYLTKLRLGGSGISFNISGFNSRNLDVSSGAFGVRFSLAEGAQKSIALPYVPKEKVKAEKAIDGFIDGKKTLDDLKTVQNFLKSF